MRLSPSLLPATDMPSPEQIGKHRIAIGIDEATLSPVVLDFEADPHFIVFGDTGCGKSNVLKLIMQGIVARKTPKEARMVVIDYRRSLLDTAATEHRIGYAVASTAAAELVQEVRHALLKRLPPADLTPDQLRRRNWWQRSDLYVVVDDYDLVATSNNPLQPLAELLPQARDIGLHLIMARQMGGASRAMYDQAVQRLKEMASPALIMSGNREEGVLFGKVRPQPLPPGRGFHVDRKSGDPLRRLRTRSSRPGHVEGPSRYRVGLLHQHPLSWRAGLRSGRGEGRLDQDPLMSAGSKPSGRLRNG
ncbi:FtsK/SpoIIIE domain-containing protein [Nonomuraea turkmeniaca]|uniref:FtsK/SpoIIIE domain-containing protein n=1 Tax=Nonomuraea turkmeniaca TaxID=103838 RepID=UPI001FECFB1C|nr:FtsK/SpoIIIE domain-containing protein [Nonomuraea turkmeniaca]